MSASGSSTSTSTTASGSGLTATPPSYSTMNEAFAALVDEASHTAPTENTTPDKIIPAKAISIVMLPGHSKQIELFKAFKRLKLDLSKLNLDPHLSDNMDINPLGRIAKEMISKPASNYFTGFANYKKITFGNDVAVKRVLINLISESAGYYSLIQEITGVTWAKDVFIRILIKTGFRSSITSPEPQLPVGEAILRYFSELTMNTQHINASDDIYEHLDAYCAEKMYIVTFLQSTTDYQVNNIHAIQSLINGLPAVFKREFDIYRKLQNKTFRTIKDASDTLLEFQSTKQFTFSQIKDGTEMSTNPDKIMSELPVNVVINTTVTPTVTPATVTQQPTAQTTTATANVARAGGDKKNNRRKEKSFNNNKNNNGNNQQRNNNNNGGYRPPFQRGGGRGFNNGRGGRGGGRGNYSGRYQNYGRGNQNWDYQNRNQQNNGYNNNQGYGGNNNNGTYFRQNNNNNNGNNNGGKRPYFVEQPQQQTQSFDSSWQEGPKQFAKKFRTQMNDNYNNNDQSDPYHG